ncbi:winged helix-turn-helix domain-containing protein [Aromatoleum anaerobium]|uniref:Helix-turn-helix domain-containing protein n=1 Tax=Aromatoleum anaerobium TaxID=182180 RepID=A0ABX1PP97_9RHOO|nr:winged helix-turn-helix domain-containing protein [Aromatoleum anaerobium]MCK0505459.1 winged helix-turn-helix domain-containing protein [Aromatoleum anaerobium]
MTPFQAKSRPRVVPLSRVRPPLSGPSTAHISAQFGPCAYERFTPSCAPFETPLSNPSKWRHYADHARRLYADPRVRCRLLALAYVQAGHSAYEADELFGLTAVQIRQWIKRYNAEGIEGLSDRPRPGPRSRLAPAQYAAFLARLHAGPPPESGLSAWRGEDIRCLLAEEFGLDYSLSGVYALLHRLGQSSLVPRPSHPASDPAAQAAFKKSAARHLGRRRLEPSRPAHRTLVSR